MTGVQTCALPISFNAGQLAIYVDGNLVLNGGVSVSTIRDGSEDLRDRKSVV